MPNIARVRELAAALRDGTAMDGDQRELGELLPAVFARLGSELLYAGHTLRTAAELIDDDFDETPSVLRRADAMLELAEACGI